MSSDNNIFKILTLGESGVGKTAILRRYVENKFEKHHLATIGIDYQSKIIKIKNKEIKLKIWDTAGQERYRNIAAHVYKGADGIVLVYDVTDEYSFSKISDWMEQINNNLSKNDIGIILIGNKNDIEERMIDTQKGQEKAKEYEIEFYETSALTGVGINEAFEGLAKQILKNYKIKDNAGSRTISLQSSKPEEVIETDKKKKKCC